jgi:hypothetical protein
VTNWATINKTKHVNTLNEKYLLGTGNTKLTTKKNVNNIGKAGLAPVSAPNKDIHTINNITGTANKT